MELNEGPQQVVIPEQRYWSCFACKHYEYRMTSSGMNPQYESICKKLDMYGREVTPNDTGYPFFLFVLDDGKTPQQCPFLKSTDREQKLNELGI
jgi:hypothetical protein